MLETAVPETFTAQDAQRILQDYPAHPDSNHRILYLPDNPAIVVPMIKGGWIHAAIIQASDELKAALQHPDNLQHPEQITRDSGNINTALTQIPPRILHNLNAFQQQRIRACTRFMNAAGYSNEQTQMYLLTYQRNSGTSFVPKLHVDCAFNVYTATFGAPLQFLTLDVGLDLRMRTAQSSHIFEEQIAFLEQALKTEKGIRVDLREHFANLEPGDIAVFGGGFLHKSSEFVPVQGQVAYNFSPYNEIIKAERKSKSSLAFIEPS